MHAVIICFVGWQDIVGLQGVKSHLTYCKLALDLPVSLQQLLQNQQTQHSKNWTSSSDIVFELVKQHFPVDNKEEARDGTLLFLQEENMLLGMFVGKSENFTNALIHERKN